MTLDGQEIGKATVAAGGIENRGTAVELQRGQDLVDSAVEAIQDWKRSCRNDVRKDLTSSPPKVDNESGLSAWVATS